MLAMIWLAVVFVLVIVVWRRFGLGTSSLWRVALVALGTGIILSAGLYLAWWLQPPTNPAPWLSMLSDGLLLFPLFFVVGSNITAIQLLAPVLMAIEVSLVLLVAMSAARWAVRISSRRSQG